VLWQSGFHGFHLRWVLLNVPWRLGGRAICCFAYFLSLLLVNLANCCRNLHAFNAVLLCHGRFWDGFTSAASASLWPVTSRDHPQTHRTAVSMNSCKHVSLHQEGQQVDRDRPVDRRSSAGRSRLILHWIDKITEKNTFNQYQYSRKYIKFSINWLVTYILWCLLWWLTIG